MREKSASEGTPPCFSQSSFLKTTTPFTKKNRGAVADRTGHRKAVAVFVFAMSSVFRHLLVYAADDVTLFGVLLLLSSIFYSAVASLIDSIVVSSLPESDRADFGRLRLFGSLGNGLASCLVMWMGQERFVPTVFRIDAVSSALAVACMCACLPAGGGRREGKDGAVVDRRFTRQESYARGTREVFGNVQILVLFATVVVMGCSLSVMENFAYIQIGEVYDSLPPGQAIHASRDLGLYRAAFTVGGVATSWWSGKLQRALGPDAVMSAGICCLPLTFFLYVGFPAGGIPTMAAFLAAEFIRSAIFNLGESPRLCVCASFSTDTLIETIQSGSQRRCVSSSSLPPACGHRCRA